MIFIKHYILSLVTADIHIEEQIRMAVYTTSLVRLPHL